MIWRGRRGCAHFAFERRAVEATGDLQAGHFSFFEYDLAETDLAEVLDRARTPSLMAPFQVFFVRGVKNLFGRGSNQEKLAAIEKYCQNPNPDALVVFVADHISIPADVRRMEMQDKERYQRIRETMASTAAWSSWPG